MNASGGCEAAVTARTRIGWMKFREYEEMLHGKRYSLNIEVVWDLRYCMEVRHGVWGKRSCQFWERERESHG